MGTLRGVFLLLSFFPQYLWKLYFPNFDTVLPSHFVLHFTMSLLGFITHSPPLPSSFHSYAALFPFLIPLFSIGSFNVFTLSYTIKWGKVGNCGKFLYFFIFLSFILSFSLYYLLYLFFSYFTCFTFFWVLWVKWEYYQYYYSIYYYYLYLYYLSSIYYQQYYYIVLFFLCLFPTHSLRSFVRSSA